MTICDRCSDLSMSARGTTVTVMQNSSTILTHAQDLCADCQRNLKHEIEEFLKPIPRIGK